MKRKLITTVLFSLFGSASMIPAAAQANNRSVEAALANYSDVSMFYRALIDTGVMNELKPNMHYTIFAPTNASFVQILPQADPCFSERQCRAHLASILRNHIVTGSRDLKELTRETEIPTIGRNWLYAESPYVHQYTIARRDILSGEDLSGNMVYRIDGVIASRQQLVQLHTLPQPLAENQGMPVEKTTITYREMPVYWIRNVERRPNDVTETITDKRYIGPDGVQVGGEETVVHNYVP